MPQVETVIREVEHDISSGWYKIVTDAGDFPTKIPDKASEALGLKLKTVLLEYDEQVKTKPGRDGQMRTYRNKYYNRAGEIAGRAAPGNGGFAVVGAPERADDQGFSPPTPEYNRRTNPDDAWRMALTSGSERAVQTLPLMPNEQRTFQIQKDIALAWARFIFFTPPPPPLEDASPTRPAPPTPASGFAATPIGLASASEAPPDMSEPGPGDDIPF